MVQIFAEYEGNLKVVLHHEPSGSSLQTSAPKDNQGLGDNFSPTDLLATSLLSCMMTLMGIEARRRSLEITGSTGRIEKHMTADPYRRVGKLVIHIEVKGEVSEEDSKALVYVAENCPVRKSISEAIIVEATFGFEQS